MKLEITKETSASDVQEKFSQQYPAPKLEFYKEKSEDGINKEDALPETIHFKKSANISIDKERSVADLEKDFRDNTGVTAQVFRQSGNIWLQTTRTDDWTLERQNTHGAEMEKL